MSSARKTAQALLPRDVFRLPGERNGKKAVVVSCERHSETIGVNFLIVKEGGRRLGTEEGWTSLRNNDPVNIIGVWADGQLVAGATDGVVQLFNEPGEDQEKGRAKMATRTARKGNTKNANAKAKSATKAATSDRAPRATDAELDKLAARVVNLRDVKNQAWGDIAETLDIAPSRLRALYNRGGGEPTRERKGTAKAATGAAAKNTKSAGKAAPKRGRGRKAATEDPSE